MKIHLSKHLLYSLLVFAFLNANANAQTERVSIADFSNTGLENWESKSFSGTTQYELIQENGSTVLQADSFNSGSGMARKIKVDLNKTPYLNWSWKIKSALPELDETTKAGDDFAARIYIIKSGGALIWKTKALNYVWSTKQSLNEGINDSWPNPFQPKNAMMVALRSSNDNINTWVHEKRDVRKDFNTFFDKELNSIDAVAIMTDTDNSDSSASAVYGDIYFTSE